MGANQIQGGLDTWMKSAHPELFADNRPTQGGNPGQISTIGGDWAGVDKWDSTLMGVIRNVQAQTGVYVPANVVKAVMRIESNGDPNAGPAYGLLQVTGPDKYGNPNTLGGFNQEQVNQARTDPAYGLLLGVKELALRYQGAQAQDPSYGWSNAIVGYFSGHYTPNGAADSLGTSDYDYLNRFNQFYNELAAATGNPTGTPVDLKQFTSIWGGFDVPITQEYGHTEFSDTSGDYYNYGAAYTRDGKPMGHPGVDVGVSYGTPLYSPVSGTVTIAGGSGYYQDKKQGDGPGVGELLLTLDNGDQIILGHMSSIGLHIGDKVKAGDYVGRSGYENGDHVHVEYRRYVGAGVTSSGYEVVDPRNALSGVFTGTYGTAGQFTTATSQGNWQQFMRAAAEGRPLTGLAPGSQSFHNWLLDRMNGVVTNADQWGQPSSWYYNSQPSGPTGSGQFMR